MPRRETLSPGGAPLPVWHFGPEGEGPAVYLQAALHADEVAASLALEHLIPLLTAAEAAGQLTAQITLVPHCNPMGLHQFAGGRHIGRFTLDAEENFNRGVPDLSAPVREGLLALPEGQRTRAAARQIGLDWLKAQAPGLTGRAALHNQLMQLSWGAARVYDVHTDMEALVHLYTSAAAWPAFEELAGLTGTRVVMLADQTADGCFDEAHGLAWAQIAPLLDAPDSGSCAACTLELRGLADASDAQGAADAAAIFADLARTGYVAAEAPAPDVTPLTVSLNAVDMVLAPLTGIFLPLVAPGDEVVAGQPVAEILDPATEGEARRLVLRARTSGLVFARWHQRVIQKGMAGVKIAGRTGDLQSDAKLPD